MSKIQIIKCHLCEKDIKAGFVLGQEGDVVENHLFYEMYLVHNDLSKVYKGNDGEKLMCASPICEECFEKILNKSIIKENEKT